MDTRPNLSAERKRPPLTLISAGERYPYQHPGFDGTLYLRRLDARTREAIDAKYRTIETTQFGMRIVVIAPEKQLEIRADQLDHVIVDWEGILDGDQNPAPCTRDNKLLLGTSVHDAVLVWSLGGALLPEGADPTRR